jgi:hypothetical protein
VALPRAVRAGLLFPREDAFYIESFLKWIITISEEMRVAVRQMSLEERSSQTHAHARS